MVDYKTRYHEWKIALEGTDFKAELQQIGMDETLCSESFYQDMEFGTAGMRGILGLGTNRMNVFTVRRATQALANHLNSKGMAQRGVAIAYDTRRNSDLFAKETAGVLLANGVKVYLYSTPHSVPQLSFTILQLGCAAGVVITASHNPPEYNGYKVYGEDGGQLSVADSTEITTNIASINNMFEITAAPLQGSPLLEYVGEELDTIYYSKVEALVTNKDAIRQQAEKLNIVYTPLYGTGLVPIRQVLTNIGIRKLHIVPEQEHPNPDFPTVSAPNPENRECFDLAITLANTVGADLILATDPDCDRLGLAVRDKNGSFIILTGNEIGCLLMEYQLSQQQSQLKGDEFVVKSIVTTDMTDVITQHYGVELRSVYTGFKFIAEQIKISEQTKKGSFLFGYEESYGYLFGSFVRDKDAVQAAMKVTEAACYYAEQGKTLYDALIDLYNKYSWYGEEVVSNTLQGQAGIAKIKNAVELLRKNTPHAVGNFKVTAVRDYLKQTRTTLANGTVENIPMDSMNVLYFELDGGRMIVRPSGTEPKLKTYLSVYAANEAASNTQLQKLKEAATTLIGDLLEG